MSAIILARLAALEAEVKTLREVPPLESFTASLKAASPEQVKEWMDLCNEVAGEYMAKDVKPKVVKEKKATTNETGPSEWNVFVNAVWHEMAASEGIVGEHDADFKKACKDAGITYQGALKEASRRKAELEGTVPKVKVAKEAKAKVAKEATTLEAVQAKVAAAKVAKVAAPVAAAKAPAKVVSSELDRQLAAAADMGWVVVEHEGETFFHDPSGDLAFSYPDGDEQIGTYTAATNFADAEFIRSEDE